MIFSYKNVIDHKSSDGIRFDRGDSRGFCPLTHVVLMKDKLFNMEKGPYMSGGEYVFALYKAKAHKEAALEAVLKKHIGVLRKQGFATPRKALVLKSKNESTYIEIFEWVSQKSIDDAHNNPSVKKIWEEFDAAADYKKLGDLAEAANLFPSFIAMDHLITE